MVAGGVSLTQTRFLRPGLRILGHIVASRQIDKEVPVQTELTITAKMRHVGTGEDGPTAGGLSGHR